MPIAGVVYTQLYTNIGISVVTPVFKKIKNRRNALSKCSFVKFANRERISLKAVSPLVWVCWKAVILREDNKKRNKLIKNNSNDKLPDYICSIHYNNNYNLV